MEGLGDGMATALAAAQHRLSTSKWPPPGHFRAALGNSPTTQKPQQFQGLQVHNSRASVRAKGDRGEGTLAGRGA